jgi:hypothetical protein
MPTGADPAICAYVTEPTACRAHVSVMVHQLPAPITPADGAGPVRVWLGDLGWLLCAAGWRVTALL